MVDSVRNLPAPVRANYDQNLCYFQRGQDEITGKLTERPKDKRTGQPIQNSTSLREYRSSSTLWNTFTEALWIPGAVFFKATQTVGSFIGYSVTALFVLPFSVGAGIGVATARSGYDYFSGRPGAKSFLDYTIETVQFVCNNFLKLADPACRWLATFTIAAIDPIPFIVLSGSACIAVAASPFIYYEFAYNNPRNDENYVEKFDRFLMTPNQDHTNLFRGRCLDITSKDVDDYIIQPYCSIIKKAVRVLYPSQVSTFLGANETPTVRRTSVLPLLGSYSAGIG